MTLIAATEIAPHAGDGAHVEGSLMSDVTPAQLTPKALAEELAISPKTLRGFLRKHYTRHPEAKNTSWNIDADAATAARARFAKADDAPALNPLTGHPLTYLELDEALADAYPEA